MAWTSGNGHKNYKKMAWAIRKTLLYTLMPDGYLNVKINFHWYFLRV